MASQTLVNAFLLVNAVDLSDHVQSITLNYSAALVDKTAMGNASIARLAGLKDWSLDIVFFNDYAAAKVDATIQAALGTQIAIEVRPTTGARSATNPGYTGNGIVESYQPIAGKVGDALMTSVKISGSDGVALVRNIV